MKNIQKLPFYLTTLILLAVYFSLAYSQPGLSLTAQAPTSPLPAQPGLVKETAKLSRHPAGQSVPLSQGDGYEEDEFFEPPQLSGPEQRLDTTHFRIHYTLSGDDAVSMADDNANNHPDYVDAVAQAMEYAWQVEIDQYGWAAPPPDNGWGGNNLYDVYLHNIFEDGTAGYTDGGFPETIIGDNPHTPAVETRASFSFIGLDNDYVEEAKAPLTRLDFMRSTAAHEFMHALQFGYDGEEPADWLWEATATWIQDEVYDDLNDGNKELPAVFKSPDSCQLAEGGQARIESDGHWYGLWIFLRYISEQHGHQAVRAIWEQARHLDGYATLEAALANAGLSLDETQRGFAVSLLTRDFEEGADYPTVRLEGETRTGQTFIPVDGVGQMAADYIQIQADRPVTVSLSATDLTGMLVGIENGQAHIFRMPGNQATVEAGQFEYLYLIVVNLKRAVSEVACHMTDYSVTVQPANTTGRSPDQIVAVPNFQPPSVEPLLDPDEYGAEEDDWGDEDEEDWADDDWSDSEVIAPPTELLPTHVPDDYHLDGAYQFVSSEFELDQEELL